MKLVSALSDCTEIPYEAFYLIDLLDLMEIKTDIFSKLNNIYKMWSNFSCIYRLGEDRKANHPEWVPTVQSK